MCVLCCIFHSFSCHLQKTSVFNPDENELFLSFLSFASGHLQILHKNIFSYKFNFCRKTTKSLNVYISVVLTTNQIFHQILFLNCHQYECYQYEFALGLEASLNCVPLWILLPFAKGKQTNKNSVFPFLSHGYFLFNFLISS